MVDRNDIYEELMIGPSAQHSQSKLASLSPIFMMASNFWAGHSLPYKIFALARSSNLNVALKQGPMRCSGGGAPYGLCVCL